MILDRKENKETCAICFEIIIPRKKNKELSQQVPSKIYGNNLIMEKTKNIFWFVNISKYHCQEMGLMSSTILQLSGKVRQSQLGQNLLLGE